MLVFAGLGNPGQSCAHNRHNIGFMVVDAIARAHDFLPWTSKFSGQICEGRLGAQKVMLVKPMTFMNLSGQTVGELTRFYKLGPDAVSVFYDELDLAPGKVRIKVGGGAGGHNGIKSLDAHIGKEYRRIRLGIGHPGHKDRVSPYVLGDFSKADKEWLEPLIDAAARAAPLLTEGDGSQFMNKIAVATGEKKNSPENTSEAAKKPKQQSHIHGARTNSNIKPNIPQSGPMADMLKKLFGNKE